MYLVKFDDYDLAILLQNFSFMDIILQCLLSNIYFFAFFLKTVGLTRVNPLFVKFSLNYRIYYFDLNLTFYSKVNCLIYHYRLC